MCNDIVSFDTQNVINLFMTSKTKIPNPAFIHRSTLEKKMYKQEYVQH